MTDAVLIVVVIWLLPGLRTGADLSLLDIVVITAIYGLLNAFVRPALDLLLMPFLVQSYGLVLVREIAQRAADQSGPTVTSQRTSTKRYGIARVMPIFDFAPKYQGAWLRPDLIAGITVRPWLSPNRWGMPASLASRFSTAAPSHRSVG